MHVERPLPNERAYPRLPRRIHAVTIDGAIVVGSLLLVILVLGPLKPEPWVFAILVSGILLLEPILVTRTKGSIGHHLLGVQVVDYHSGAPIGFPRAVARMLGRGLFGLISLFFIHTTREYRALHDILTGSVVVLRNPSAMAPREVRTEQTLEVSQYQYPSLPRRGLVIVIYSVLTFLTINIVAVTIVADECASQSRCDATEEVVLQLAGWAMLILLGTLMVLGVKGRLWGARRYPGENTNDA